jgi:hypothetical protein
MIRQAEHDDETVVSVQPKIIRAEHEPKALDDETVVSVQPKII